MAYPLLAFLLLILGLVAVGLVIAFVLVPVLKGVGQLIALTFRGIGWLISHIVEFIIGMLSDAVRFVGAIIAMTIFALLAPANVIIARWSAAGHYAESIHRELKVAGGCLYRVLLRRPLKLVLLHGLLEGLEQRVPDAVAAAPTSDKPSRHLGDFEGYTIVGSLPAGGSGAKLYIAEPDAHKRRDIPNMPERVVIKAFTVAEGSTLPQIIRESRALDCARKLGHVLDHGLDEHRFHYVMPYHAGQHLGIITRQMHAESDGTSLSQRQLREVCGYIEDLLYTLSTYHKGGLWHKDVKPENVIVNAGHAVLVDLGLVTPLRSAMTLTTHGTEYFRDPELVRQALRGVKVHQIDGTKFDIYAVGAVLYFVLENTFPAHGGLSKFTKNSPQALRWIVRRAMADYNNRYNTADEMLADLRIIAQAENMQAVKPAALPSMSQDDAPDIQAPETEADTDADVVAAHKAGSPTPPRDARDQSNREHRDAHEPVGPPPHHHDVHNDFNQSSPPRKRRPKLRLTNWWTGAYTVEDDDRESAPGMHDDASGHNAPFAATAASRRGKPRPQPATDVFGQPLRKSAREQVIEARRRARDMQRRARTKKPGRHNQAAMAMRAPAERQPSPTLAAVVLVFLLLIAGGIYIAVKPAMEQQSVARARVDQARQQLDERIRERLAQAGMASTDSSRNIIASHNISLLLVNDHPLPSDPTIKRRVQSITDSMRAAGLNIITDTDIEAKVHAVMPPGSASHNSGVASARLAKVLTRNDLAGVLVVDAEPGAGPAYSRFRVRPIIVPGRFRSSKAQQTSGPSQAPAPPEMPETPDVPEPPAPADGPNSSETPDAWENDSPPHGAPDTNKQTMHFRFHDFYHDHHHRECETEHTVEHECAHIQQCVRDEDQRMRNKAA